MTICEIPSKARRVTRISITGGGGSIGLPRTRTQEGEGGGEGKSEDGTGLGHNFCNPQTESDPNTLCHGGRTGFEGP